MVKFKHIYSEAKGCLCVADEGEFAVNDPIKEHDLLFEIMNFIVNNEASRMFHVDGMSFMVYRENMIVSDSSVLFYNCIKYF